MVGWLVGWLVADDAVRNYLTRSIEVAMFAFL
jgi:hypothetical protein